MHKIVTLVSGGLDSTVMALLIARESVPQMPLFIDYGQLNRDREFAACKENFRRHGLPEPSVLDVRGYGSFFSCGLTDTRKDILKDAFLPGRNMLFLLCAGAYAHAQRADAVAIGFLNEKLSLFADQRRDFADAAGRLLSSIMQIPLDVLTPLIELDKAEVLAIARELGISLTYSCHAGGAKPCGRCIACREYIGLEV